MKIIDILKDINNELASLRPIKQPSKTSRCIIPAFKLQETKNEYTHKLYEFLISTFEQIKSKQAPYDELYKENLSKRYLYVTNTLEKYKNDLNSEEIQKKKDLKSKIDFLKSQGNFKLEKIEIDESNTAKIFKCLDSVNLVNEYEHFREFLERKIHFKYEVPTQKELVSLQKMANLLKSTRKEGST